MKTMTAAPTDYGWNQGFISAFKFSPEKITAAVLRAVLFPRSCDSFPSCVITSGLPRIHKETLGEKNSQLQGLRLCRNPKARVLPRHSMTHDPSAVGGFFLDFEKHLLSSNESAREGRLRRAKERRVNSQLSRAQLDCRLNRPCVLLNIYQFIYYPVLFHWLEEEEG